MIAPSFWEPEREANILRDKSRLKEIEIVDRKDCEQIIIPKHGI